jgi:hypothetical protein
MGIVGIARGYRVLVISAVIAGCGGSSGGSGGLPSGPFGSGSGSGGGSGDDSGVGSSGGAGGSSGGSSSGGSSGSSGGSGNGSGGTSSSGDAGGSRVGPGTDGGSSGGVGCPGQSLPPLSDYSQNGPFATTTINNTGPTSSYTAVQPSTLGQNGFKHPIATWGNGITTTPSVYPQLLGAIASNGFVIIASNSTSVTAQNMTDGLDWMIQQNGMSGPYQGKLDTKCLVTIGYSLGGGASVTSGSHAGVVTTVSFHGVQGTSQSLHAPLLLFTSTGDTFVTASGFVTPTFNASVVQTFYATLTGGSSAGDNGHLTPVGNAGPERAPAIAWLRLWVYGDQNARSYFYGSGATLCQTPWSCQTKMPGATAKMSGF